MPLSSSDSRSAPHGSDLQEAPDIAAVVVTFNRSSMVVELVESLLQQTCRLAAIFVVDNGSNDDTEQRLRRLAAEHPTIRYIRSPINTGGSGGFSQGVRAAHAAGHGWFWLMDDDVRAFPDGLAGLVPYLDRGGCIHGRRRDFNGRPFFWQCRFSEALAMPRPVIGNVFRQGSTFETNVGVFEGMLVSRAVVDCIGLPDARFFITWDDAIYGWLASKCTTVLYIDHYALERRRHQRQISLGFRHLNDATDLYRFHTVRNRPLVRVYMQRAGVYRPFWFAVGTALILLKETLRLVVVERRPRGFGALWLGWKASRLAAPPTVDRTPRPIRKKAT